MSNFRTLVEGEPLDNIETRPGTNEKQLSNRKGAFRDAIRPIDKKRGARVLASAIPANMEDHYRNRGNFGFIGQKVGSPHDVAKLAQVYRDPRFETFHMVYTKGDEVVGHSALTNRLPAAVHFYSDDEHAQRDIHTIRFHMDNIDADGYWMIHNHPSGSSEPSSADHSISKHFSENIPGFRGHIVVDHNEYSHIKINDNGDSHHSTHDIDNVRHSYDLNQHSLPHDVIGKPAYSSRSAVSIGREFKKVGHSVIIGTNAHGRVNSISSFPSHLLYANEDDKVAQLKSVARVRHFIRQSGSGGNVVIATHNSDHAERMSHLVKSGVAIDVVGIQDGTSLRNQMDPEHPRDKVGGNVKFFGGLSVPHKEL